MIPSGSPPTTLAALPRWVAWRHETRKGTTTKIPFTPGTTLWAHTDKPETWGSYGDACAMQGCDGPGLVLTGLADVTALDLDHCRDAVTGRIEPWALAICDQAQSYTEISPSGTGLHILGLAPTLPATTTVLPMGEGQQCEVYAGGATRYLCITWQWLEDYPNELNDITQTVRELLDAARRLKPARVALANDNPAPNGNGAAGILNSLPNDYSRADWIRLGMAAKSAGGTLAEFDRWSARHPSYDEGETARVWNSLKPNGSITGATLAHEARQHGVEMPAEPTREKAQPDDEPPRKRIVASPYLWKPPSMLPRRDPLYGAHSHRGYVSATIAAGGIGKSTLVIGEAIDMASRKTLFHPVRRPLRVWIWNLEDPQDELERRVGAALAFHRLGPDDIEDRLFLNSGRDLPLTLATMTRGTLHIAEDQVAEIIEQILEKEIDVLTIDPFVSAHRVPENDNVALTAVLDRLRHIAHVGNAAIEIVHHSRKSNGLGAEPSADDARGASATIGGVRSARVASVMTREEAELAQVAPERRRFFFRVDNVKANMAPPALAATWRKLVDVDLGNGSDDEPSDHVQAVEAWHMPGLFANATEAQLSQLQAEMGEGEFATSPRAGDWLGYIVAKVFGLDVATAGARKRIQEMLAVWERTGAIIRTERYNKNKQRAQSIYQCGIRG